MLIKNAKIFTMEDDLIIDNGFIFIENNIIKSLKILGGCPGNTVGVSKLVEGKDIETVIKLLKGIPCRDKGTSCPDQVAKALEQYKKQIH